MRDQLNMPWRERVRRSVMWTSFAIALPLAMYAGPAGWEKLQTHGEVAGYQQQCMLHCRPAMQTVYDDDPVLATMVPPPGFIKGSFDLSQRGRTYTALPAECWTNLNMLLNPLETRPRIPLFLHERCACDLRRLVAVALENRRDESNGITLTLGCYQMAAASTLCVPALDAVERRLFIPCDPAKTSVRFFCGVPDAANPARFTIRFEANQQIGSLIGALSPEDAVNLYLAPGPFKLD